MKKHLIIAAALVMGGCQSGFYETTSYTTEQLQARLSETAFEAPVVEEYSDVTPPHRMLLNDCMLYGQDYTQNAGLNDYESVIKTIDHNPSYTAYTYYIWGTDSVIKVGCENDTVSLQKASYAPHAEPIVVPEMRHDPENYDQDKSDEYDPLTDI